MEDKSEEFWEKALKNHYATVEHKPFNGFKQAWKDFLKNSPDVFNDYHYDTILMTIMNFMPKITASPLQRENAYNTHIQNSDNGWYDIFDMKNMDYFNLGGQQSHAIVSNNSDPKKKKKKKRKIY